MLSGIFLRYAMSVFSEWFLKQDSVGNYRSHLICTPTSEQLSWFSCPYNRIHQAKDWAQRGLWLSNVFLWSAMTVYFLDSLKDLEISKMSSVLLNFRDVSYSFQKLDRVSQLKAHKITSILYMSQILIPWKLQTCFGKYIAMQQAETLLISSKLVFSLMWIFQSFYNFCCNRVQQQIEIKYYCFR
jgi:hypothetical protein